MVAQLIEDALDPAHDEYRLAAPHDLQHLSRFELGCIHFDRSAQRFGPRTRLPRSQERDRRECNADRSGADGGRRQQAAPAMVNLIAHSIVPTQC